MEQTKEEKLTVLEVSEILNMSPISVRRGILQQTLPIGAAIKHEGNYSFHIYKRKLDKWLGGIE